MRTHLTKLFTGLFALGALALTGCSSDYRVDFQILTDAPPEVFVTSDLIEIPAGMAVGVRALPVVDDERTNDRLDLFPQRNNIVGIEPGLEERTWVIWAKNPGSTAVDVFIDGERVTSLTAVGLDPLVD